MSTVLTYGMLESERSEKEVLQQHFFSERNRLVAENHRILICLDESFQAVVESAMCMVTSTPNSQTARDFLSVACENYLRFLQTCEDFDQSNYELSELEIPECLCPCH